MDVKLYLAYILRPLTDLRQNVDQRCRGPSRCSPARSNPFQPAGPGAGNS